MPKVTAKYLYKYVWLSARFLTDTPQLEKKIQSFPLVFTTLWWRDLVHTIFSSSHHYPFTPRMP